MLLETFNDRLTSTASSSLVARSSETNLQAKYRATLTVDDSASKGSNTTCRTAEANATTLAVLSNATSSRRRGGG